MEDSSDSEGPPVVVRRKKRRRVEEEEEEEPEAQSFKSEAFKISLLAILGLTSWYIQNKMFNKPPGEEKKACSAEKGGGEGEEACACAYSSHA
jgi:hypothetical protein